MQADPPAQVPVPLHNQQLLSALSVLIHSESGETLSLGTKGGSMLNLGSGAGVNGRMLSARRELNKSRGEGSNVIEFRTPIAFPKTSRSTSINGPVPPRFGNRLNQSFMTLLLMVTL